MLFRALAVVVLAVTVSAGCAVATPPPRFSAVSPADPDAPEGAAAPARSLDPAGPPVAPPAAPPAAAPSAHGHHGHHGHAAPVAGPAADRQAPAPGPEEAPGALAGESDPSPDALTLDAAVARALGNNPALLASFEEVGISGADLEQASRLANPELAGRIGFAGSGERRVELSLVQDLFDLLARPLRRKLAAAELEATKARLADAVLSLSADVKEAFFTLQARIEGASILESVRALQAAAADFAREQHRAGTLGELELAHRVAAEQDARAHVAAARAEAHAERERLNRLLGLWGTDTAWTVAAALPPVPADEIPLEGLERLAIENRPDLRAARWGVDAVGRALALRRKTRFFPIGLQAGIETEKEGDGPRVTGPELTLQLPLFDTGKASIARLEAEHRRAQRQLEALAVDARAEVREQRDRMLAAREREEHYRRVVVPQRSRILALTVQHFNAMFLGAYDVLEAKRSEVEAREAHLAACLDYWVARARLERALGGTLPAAPVAAATLDEGRAR